MGSISKWCSLPTWMTPRDWPLDCLRSWLQKPTCRSRWLPNPIAWNWAACGYCRIETWRSRFFFGKEGGAGGYDSSISWDSPCRSFPMWDARSAGNLCSQHPLFWSCYLPPRVGDETVAEHHKSKVSDCSHTGPIDTFIRTGRALPWCSVQVRMSWNEHLIDVNCQDSSPARCLPVQLRTSSLPSGRKQSTGNALQQTGKSALVYSSIIYN